MQLGWIGSAGAVLFAAALQAFGDGARQREAEFGERAHDARKEPSQS